MSGDMKARPKNDRCRSCDAVIRVYGETVNVIETTTTRAISKSGKFAFFWQRIASLA
jgi:hypothetical protein